MIETVSFNDGILYIVTAMLEVNTEYMPVALHQN